MTFRETISKSMCISLRFVCALLVLSMCLLAIACKDRIGCKPACAARMREVAAALWLYASEQGGQYPLTLSGLLSSGYLKSPTLLSCPEAAGPGAAYIYVRPSDSRATSWISQVMLYEALENHGRGGAYVAYDDGGVTWVLAAELDRLLKSQASPKEQRSP